MTDVYLNGKFLTQPVTGVQRYALELVNALYSLAPEIPVLAPRRFDKSGDRLRNKIVNTGTYGNFWWEQVATPYFLFKKHHPLFINLCNTAPVFYRNKITCIHDLSYLTNPSWFSKKFYWYYKLIIPLIIRSSRQILTVSEFSKHELMRHFKLPSHKISIIPNACSEKLLTYSGNSFSSPLKHPYFLFVGSLDPRKNIFALMEAYKQSAIADTKLVIIGAGNTSFNNDVERRLQPFKKHSGIHFMGRVNDETLAAYYQHASAVIVPSFYEGFGLPVVEALANGCKVIASDIPVFREVAGNYAEYFNPNDIHELSFLLKKFDNAVPARNKKAIDFITEKYNWTSSASQLLKVIKQSL